MATLTRQGPTGRRSRWPSLRTADRPTYSASVARDQEHVERRNEVRRALWVTEEVPDRELGGGNIRQAHLLAALADRVETHLLLVGRLHDQTVRRSLAGLTELPAHPYRPPASTLARRARDLWLAVGEHGPAEVAATRVARKRLRPAVGALAGGFDLVVVNQQTLAPLLPGTRAGRWAIHLHHASADKARQEQPLAAGRRQRWLLEREEAKARRLEDWAVGSYDVVVTVSDGDAATLTGPDRQGARGRVVVAPNGVDVDRYVPTPLPEDPRLLLAASLDYRPNVDGALWFCDQVLPLVQAEVDEVRLDLVGRRPVPEVRALADRVGVAVHPDVASMVPWLTRSRVALVPLRVGTGTRLKALEAMAAGRPVVGTGIGLGGLGLVDGTHASIADDPQAMAAAIVALVRDREGALRLARAGRELVQRRFRWDRIGSELAGALVEAGQRQATGAR